MQPTDAVQAILSEARTKDIGDVAIIATDVSGIIIYWNDQATSLYGWRSDDVVGRNVLDVTPTYSTMDEATAIMEEVRHGRTWEGEFIFRHRSGQPIHAHIREIPVRDGNTVIGAVGLSRPYRRDSQPVRRQDD